MFIVSFLWHQNDLMIIPSWDMILRVFLCLVVRSAMLRFGLEAFSVSRQVINGCFTQKLVRRTTVKISNNLPWWTLAADKHDPEFPTVLFHLQHPLDIHGYPSQVIIFLSVQARRLCHLRYLWRYLLCVVGAITLKDFGQRNKSTLLKVVTGWPLFTYHINYSLVVNNNQDMSSYIFEHCPQWQTSEGHFVKDKTKSCFFLFDFDSWHHSYWLMRLWL